MNMQRKVAPPDDIAEMLGAGAKSRRRSRLVTAALVLAAILAAWLVWRLVAGPGDAAIRYTSEAARQGAVSEIVTATGTVEPTKEVSISSELSGTIAEVLVDYNDRVSVGQPLAVLDTGKLEAEVAHARATLAVQQATLEQARATLEESRRAFERTRTLSEKDFASQATRETAEATFRRAEAGVAVAEAQVRVAEATLSADETNLAKATIRSPIDGVVLSRDVDPGQTVAASLQAPELFTLAETLASMRLEVDIDEADVGQVAPGQNATFSVEAYRDRRFPAVLETVRYLPETGDNVVTYTGVLSLDNSELLLRPGMTATAEILVQQVEDAVLIPNAALRWAPPQEAEAQSARSGGLIGLLMPRPPGDAGVARTDEAAGERDVYLLVDGEPQRASVRTGISDGTWTEVLDGEIRPGAEIITDSAEAG